MSTVSGWMGSGTMTRRLTRGLEIPNTSYPKYREHFISWTADAYVLKSPGLSELKEKVKELLSAR